MLSALGNPLLALHTPARLVCPLFSVGKILSGELQFPKPQIENDTDLTGKLEGLGYRLVAM